MLVPFEAVALSLIPIQPFCVDKPDIAIGHFVQTPDQPRTGRVGVFGIMHKVGEHARFGIETVNTLSVWHPKPSIPAFEEPGNRIGIQTINIAGIVFKLSELPGLGRSGGSVEARLRPEVRVESAKAAGPLLGYCCCCGCRGTAYLMISDRLEGWMDGFLLRPKANY